MTAQLDASLADLIRSVLQRDKYMTAEEVLAALPPHTYALLGSGDVALAAVRNALTMEIFAQQSSKIVEGAPVQPVYRLPR